MGERVKLINPDCEVKVITEVLEPDTMDAQLGTSDA